jgi:xanthine dehydrogenase/oxidase
MCHCLGSSVEWYRPIALGELLHLRRTFPGDASKLVFGNTRVQIEKKFQHQNYARLISVTHIKELQQLERTADSLILGAGVTFTCLKAKLIEWNQEKNNDGGFCQALLDQLKRFASTQIRNVASIGGNIVVASPMYVRLKRISSFNSSSALFQFGHQSGVISSWCSA